MAQLTKTALEAWQIFGGIDREKAEREKAAADKMRKDQFCERCGEDFNNADGHGECYDWTAIETLNQKS